jgi:hypothetical protein
VLALCRAVNQKEDRALAESSELGDLKCTPKTVSVQQSVIQQAIEEQRRELTGGDWRASARWLEENCEEFREAKAAPRSEEAPRPEGVSSTPESSSAELRARVPITLELQGPCIDPGCPQSSGKALPALPPIPPLESAFWQVSSMAVQML